MYRAIASFPCGSGSVGLVGGAKASRSRISQGVRNSRPLLPCTSSASSSPFVCKNTTNGISVQHFNYYHTTHACQHNHNIADRAHRIILIRHGESLGNLDDKHYVNIADHDIPLTPLGKTQAISAGEKVRRLITSSGQNNDNNNNKEEEQEDVFFYVSPYKRTRQTLRGILSQISKDSVVGIREEPRISEQQFGGSYQDLETVRDAKEERNAYGRFYFRFPNGESGFDVYLRVTSFISTIFRDCDEINSTKLNVCIITHGLALRLLLMRWFQYTVSEFEESMNPENGMIIILERKESLDKTKYWYELTEESRMNLNVPKYHEQIRFKVKDDLTLLDDDDDDWEGVK